MARPPAIKRGTPTAEQLASYCRMGWKDVKLAVEFDLSVPTVRKYRKMFAPETAQKPAKAAA